MVTENPVPVKLTTHYADPRTLWLEFGYFCLTPEQAREFARELLDKASYAGRLPSIHENHVNLLASCALCVAEAGSQPDRLTYDEEQEAD